MMLEIVILKLQESSVVFLAGFGGIAHYLYTISKAINGADIKWSLLTINFILATFLGMVLFFLIPEAVEGKYGLIMLAGFLSHPTLGLIESRGRKLFGSYIGLNGDNGKHSKGDNDKKQ